MEECFKVVQKGINGRFFSLRDFVKHRESWLSLEYVLGEEVYVYPEAEKFGYYPLVFKHLDRAIDWWQHDEHCVVLQCTCSKLLDVLVQDESGPLRLNPKKLPHDLNGIGGLSNISRAAEYLRSTRADIPHYAFPPGSYMAKNLIPQTIIRG